MGLELFGLAPEGKAIWFGILVLMTVGIGMTMQLPMDIRLASDKARIGFVFWRIGVVPEACSTWFLPRIVGLQQAMDWVYSADILTAKQALPTTIGRTLARALGREELRRLGRDLSQLAPLAAGARPIAASLLRLWLRLWAGAALQHLAGAVGEVGQGLGHDHGRAVVVTGLVDDAQLHGGGAGGVGAAGRFRPAGCGCPGRRG